ncbi:hypothetical protein LCGC14_1012460 [marine sediment metagenome]|uniref:Uncharacterized protein n=1 Tax=marine sediment metagenome TaxID=412755 RepID=A0A0F9MZX7_9ZZZZ
MRQRLRGGVSVYAWGLVVPGVILHAAVLRPSFQRAAPPALTALCSHQYFAVFLCDYEGGPVVAIERHPHSCADWQVIVFLSSHGLTFAAEGLVQG